MIKTMSIKIGLVSLASFFCITAQAMPTKEVIFEKGSNCGYAQGDLSSGSIFLIEMKPNQQLDISTDGHVQSVTDSKGQTLKDNGGARYSYHSNYGGTHTIKMVGRADSVIEFCVE